MIRVSDFDFKKVEKEDCFNILFGDKLAYKIVNDYKYTLYKDNDKYYLQVYHLGYGLIANFKHLTEEEANKILKDYQENRANDFKKEQTEIAIESFRNYKACKNNLIETFKDVYAKVYYYNKNHKLNNIYIKNNFNISPENIYDIRIENLLEETNNFKEQIVFTFKSKGTKLLNIVDIPKSWLLESDNFDINDIEGKIGVEEISEPLNLKTDDFYWKLIETINWKKISSESNDYNNKVCEIVTSTLSENAIKELSDFIKDKYRFLINLMKYCSYSLKLGDDSTWDICAHVVGCGKNAFYEVVNNPSSIEKYKPLYKENFIYGFSKALETFNK